MKTGYMMILNDISPQEFKKMLEIEDLADEVSVFVKFDNKPNFMDCLYIDSVDELPSTDWKHVIKINDMDRLGFQIEVLDYITSFGRTITNLY